MLTKTEITRAFTGATEGVEGVVQVALSADFWSSSSGKDICAVCADVVNCFTFEHVSAVVACQEMTGKKTSENIARFLEGVVVGMDVPGWDSLTKAVSSLTTDSAYSMLGVASAVEQQEAVVTQSINVPPIGSSIVILEGNGDTGFWHAIVYEVEVDEEGNLISIAVHWVNEKNQLEGLDEIVHPWWGTTSDSDPDKVRERRANRKITVTATVTLLRHLSIYHHRFSRLTARQSVLMTARLTISVGVPPGFLVHPRSLRSWTYLGFSVFRASHTSSIHA